MRRSLRLALVAAVSTLTLAAAAPLSASPPGGSYTVTKLVSDVPGEAALTDPNLVNGWGLTRGPTTPWWVSDNGTDKSTLYARNGTSISINPLVVGVDGGPTGAVFANVPPNFPVSGGPAAFIFASEDGMIRAWHGGLASAPVTVHGGTAAVYKGLAIAQTGAGPMLYATDFHNARVDVFNGAWQNVTPAGSFLDPMIPSGYGPFGIQVIGTRVFVSYAKQDAAAHDDVAGQSLGFVDAYDLSGNLLTRVAQRGQLNSPWGLALAPASFGRFAGDLLVGNFGDGQINAYEETSAGFEHRGTLRDATGGKLVIDGLWALQFGNAGNNGNPDTLFFTAGPDGESHGLFGTITPAG